MPSGIPNSPLSKNPLPKKPTRQKVERINTEYLSFRYKPEQLTQKTIDRICKYYMEGIQIGDIVRKVNGPRPSLTTLNQADVYTILWHALHTPQYTAVEVKQRKRYREWELCIEAFPRLLQAWREGRSKKDMHLFGSPTAVDRVLHAMYLRCNAEAERMEIKAEASAIEILKYAEQHIFQGQTAWVILVNKLPKHLQDILQPGSSDIGNNDIDDSILPDSDAGDRNTGSHAEAMAGSLCPEASFPFDEELAPFKDVPEDELDYEKSETETKADATDSESQIDEISESATPPQDVQKTLEDLLS